MRKRQIAQYADAATSYYFNRYPVDSEVIAQEESITFSYGDYGDYFDGLLQHKCGSFHIFINLNRLELPYKPRARYTFAHELGHYFIDEHRIALQNGLVPSHPSFNQLISSKNPVEKEADFFASCLLMPERFMRQECQRRPLSSTLIQHIQDTFNVSTTAAIFRYFELSMFPMSIICCKEGKILWSMRTDDFTFKWLPKSGDSVPINTIAGDFFNGRSKSENEEIVYSDDWFPNNTRDNDTELYEKCYYLNANTIISIIWVKERRISY